MELLNETELLTVFECSKISRMSTAWWRQRIFRKDVKFLKIGRRVLIPKAAVEDLLAQAVVEPRRKLKTGLDNH